ncbi:MAG: hypothetical protein ACI9T9_000739 [Oleiphilaceae bacterium]|jgi:hypothetical protein
MDDQKILDNVPPKQGKWPDCNQVDSDGKWSHRQPVIRSLADIKELVELRNANAELESKLAGSKYTVDLFCVKYKEIEKDLKSCLSMLENFYKNTGSLGARSLVDKITSKHLRIKALKVGV